MKSIKQKLKETVRILMEARKPCGDCMHPDAHHQKNAFKTGKPGCEYISMRDGICECTKWVPWKNLSL